MLSFRIHLFVVLAVHCSAVVSAADSWQRMALVSSPQSVAPMTGIVLWDDNEKNETDAIQLEYSYVGYDQVISEKGVYDWQKVDRKLDAIAQRGHQAVLRFYFVYVGKPTTVSRQRAKVHRLAFAIGRIKSCKRSRSISIASLQNGTTTIRD